MVEQPQSFVARQECDKVAFQNGFRRFHEETDGWRRYSSTTAKGSVWFAFEPPSSWMIALDHQGVVAELGLRVASVSGPGIARLVFEDLGLLYSAMPRIYALSVSLPDAPLQEFLHSTHNLPNTTEAERLIVQRVGQGIFRKGLIDYWQCRCPMTSISDRTLLRASHIKPWSDCDTDGERLDVHNGFLLSALWDAAFDGGLVTFDNDGYPQFSPHLSSSAAARLEYTTPIPLTDKHRAFLDWHRERVFER